MKLKEVQKIITGIFIILNFISVFSQNCEPITKSKDGTMGFYGGAIKNGLGIMTDDKSNYTFYIVQVDKGNGGTLAYVSFYESVDSREKYNQNITDYLGAEKLKNSFIEIELNNEIIRVPANNCSLKPEKTLGEVFGYSVSFEGDISKSQVLKLQNNEISKFKIVLGGKPYEKSFSHSTKKTRDIKKSISCIDTSNMLEIKTKEATKLNLDEIDVINYSNEIKGKWLMQNEKKVTLEFIEDKIIVKESNRLISEGTYKIIGKRLIFTGHTNSGTSTFELFLKDMIILKEKGKEYTYERME